jgi:hypothetical protein
MRTIRRSVALLVSVLVLSVSALGVAGCGAGGHYLGGVVAHHAVNHFVHTARGRRRVNKVFCFYHGHRVLADLHHGHPFIAGLNALQAYHACKAGFGHH